MLTHLSLRTKLLLLPAVPLVLLFVLGGYMLMELKADTDELVSTIYDAAYTANSLMLNADRDMYQAMTALQALKMPAADSGQSAARLDELDENLRQAAERTAQAKAVTEANRVRFTQGDMDEAASLFTAALSGLDAWSRAITPLAGKLASAPAGAGEELYARIDAQQPVFERAREQLNRLEEVMDAAAKRSIDRSRTRVGTVVIVTGVMLVLALALVVLLGALLIRNIRMSLSNVIGMANAVAEGDLRADRVRVQRDDELGRLGDSINRMNDNLKDLIGSVNDTSRTVTASSQELTAGAEQTTEAAAHIVENIRQIAEGADSRRAAVLESVAVIEQIAGGSRRMNESLQAAAGSAERASAASLDGNRMIASAVERISTIEQSVSALSASVLRLGELSKETGGVTGVISDIAGQTNLLALNASIEAARAGEQGRGFSVVARQVRTSAEQSEASAHRVSLLAGTIRAGTDEAASSMPVTSRDVSAGIRTVSEADLAFHEIFAAVGELTGQIREIAAETQQLSDTAVSADRLFGSLSEVAGRTASDTRSVSAAAQQQLASMGNVTASAQSLSRMAETLQETIRRFRT